MSLSRFLFSMAAGALLATTATSCSSATRRSRPGSKPAEAARASISVDNQTFNDMNVFIVNGGQRIRLGQVTSHQRTEFTIPTTVLGAARELTFLAEPITRRGGTTTYPIWVAPGDRVEMIIPP